MLRSGHQRTAVAAVTVFLLTGLVGVVGPAAGAAGVRVELTPAAGAVVSRSLTPNKAVHGGKPFRISGDRGTIQIGGKAIPFGVRYSQTTQAFYGAMDVNDNGKLDAREWVKFSQTMSANYLVKSGEAAYAVRVADVRVYRRLTGTGITAVRGGYMVLTCQQGTFNGTSVRLFDDNLDGAFTQDGEDAIAFGRSTFAIPLMKTHQIGPHHYELGVAEDGKSITFTPVSGVELGIVELPYRRGLKCLAFSDKAGHSYDLALSARTGIPAGSYHLSYGVLVGGGLGTVIRPKKECPTYEIQAGKINRIRIGPPIRVSFSATYSGGMLTVRPDVEVLGAAGEWYSFDYSGGTGRPHVLLMADSRLLQDIPMKYG